MKIIKNNSNLTIFLSKFYIKEIDFDNKESLEKYFKKLFLKLKDNYNEEIIGFYNIYVYIDTNYGIILDVFKEELEYLGYFGSSIDMQISKPIKTNFLYEIEDLLNVDKEILNKTYIYRYDDKHYLRIKRKITDFELAKIIENATIVFNNKEITEKGKIIEVKI